MKKTILAVVAIVVTALLLVSCNKPKHKLEEAAEVLSAVPLYIEGDERSDSKVSFEDSVIYISIQRNSVLNAWAYDVVGYEWIPEVVFHNLLGGSVPTTMLAGVMETAEGGTPVNDFLDLMTEQQVNFLLNFSGKTFRLTPAEVKELMNKSTKRHTFAPIAAKQLMMYSEKFSSPDYYETNKNFSMTGATRENDTLFININYYNDTPEHIKDFAQNILFTNLAVPVFCHVNSLVLAFRYHKVTTSGELHSNTSYSPTDELQVVPDNILEEAWQKVEEKWKKQ